METTTITEKCRRING